MGWLAFFLFLEVLVVLLASEYEGDGKFLDNHGDHLSGVVSDSGSKGISL